jgi:hypothetical protein
VLILAFGLVNRLVGRMVLIVLVVVLVHVFVIDVVVVKGNLEHLDVLFRRLGVGQWDRNSEDAPVVGGADVVLVGACG